VIDLKRGRVVHAVPGRVRVKLSRDDLTEESSVELRSALLAISGVEEVRRNLRTGSLVIHYGPETLDVAGLTELARAANVLALEVLETEAYATKHRPASSTARRIQRTFLEVDVRLSELSSGRWDLRSVVPVAFGALALRQIIRDFGELGAAPWYVLAWYAFDTFWKFHQEHPPAADHAEPSSLLPADK